MGPSMRHLDIVRPCLEAIGCDRCDPGAKPASSLSYGAG